MRYDLAFFMCCCKSFVGNDSEEDGENFYALLQVERDASADDIKKAYKKQSLLMHPDKLAQRGQTVTAADQAKFTKMKEAYEVLSDQHKRETYDAIGSRGMKWLDEPFSIDPQELAHNFAKSNVVDRSKIFAIFVSVAVAILLQPVLICMHIDGTFGPNASWMATFIPLWIWNLFLIFYHTRVIMMGPIPKPDHIPENEWVDPLPMNKRIFSMFRFLLIVIFEFFVALKLDNDITASWMVLFIPLYIWEATTLYKKWPLARMRIVTVEDLEAALGKPFTEFTPAEKELIGQRYSVVSSISSPDFDAAQKLKSRAKHDIIKALFRIIFVLILLIQLDLDKEWNWWFVFIPFWIMTFIICYSNYQSYAEVKKMASEKDPVTFGFPNQQKQSSSSDNKVPTSDDPHTIDLESGGAKTCYGAVGNDGVCGIGGLATGIDGTTTSKQETDLPNQQPIPEITDEEREELKAQVMASKSRLCSKCCCQGFILIIFFLFVAKLQGAQFSSFLIISPFLFCAGILLCCLGCAIFGVTEVPTDGIDFENSGFAYTNAEQGTAPPTTTTTTTSTTSAQQQQKSDSQSMQQPVYVPPPATADSSATTAADETAFRTEDNSTSASMSYSANAVPQEQQDEQQQQPIVGSVEEKAELTAVPSPNAEVVNPLNGATPVIVNQDTENTNEAAHLAEHHDID